MNSHSGDDYLLDLLQQKDVKKDLLLCFSQQFSAKDSVTGTL